MFLRARFNRSHRKFVFYFTYKCNHLRKEKSVSVLWKLYLLAFLWEFRYNIVRMQKFFWLCLLLLIPGLLARISLGGSGILATDILVPLFAVLWIGKKIIFHEKFPRCDWMSAGIAFVSVAIVTWLIGAWDLTISAKILSAAYFIRILTMLIIGWSAGEYFQTPNYKLQTTDISLKDAFFKRFFLISSVVIVLGFIQFIFIPDISRFSTEGGWDPHTGRLLGTWLDPNYLAGFLGFLLPIIAGAWYKKRNHWLFLLGLLALVALFLTFSRSGYLAAMIGLGMFFFLRDWKIILLAILIAILGLASSERAQKRVGELTGTMASIVLQDTAEIDPTAKLRIQNWIKSVDLWKKYPVAGIGYNTYRWRAAEEGVVDENYFSAGGADGTHLTVLVTTGIIGSLVYLWFLNVLFWKPVIRWWKTRDDRQLGFAMGLLSLIVHSLFVNSLFFPLIFLPVIIIAGVLQSNDSVLLK